MASVLSLDCILAWNDGMDVLTARGDKDKLHNSLIQF